MKNKIIAIVIIIVALVFSAVIADFDFGGNKVTVGGQEIILK